MDATNLAVWLPFDTSTTLDKCGGTWTTYGNPTIGETDAVNGKALQLDGSSYLKRNETFAFTGQSFIIRHFFCGTANTTGGALCLWQLYQSTGYRIHLSINTNGTISFWANYGNSERFGITTPSSVLDGKIHHAECAHDNSTWYFFLDGSLVGTATYTYAARTFTLYIGTNYFSGRKFTGTIDEFQLYDGVALHTENFTPPTAEDYVALGLAVDGSAPFTFLADVERKVSNTVEQFADVERKVLQKWRYTNRGDADDLIIASTTLTDLPDTQSKTGSAFYQTKRAKCFDLPATDEIWLKFDVYFGGSNRWRAYNGGSGGDTGVCVESGNFCYFINQGNSLHQQFSNVQKVNTLQTVLLHMVSGSSNGVVEAWVEGTKIYTYTGDVNHGQDFADLYLQSDGAGTFFSNVIISNVEIGLGDGWQIFYFDTERQVVRSVELFADVERRVLGVIDAEIFFDVKREVVRSIEQYGDVERLLVDTGGDLFDVEVSITGANKGWQYHNPGYAEWLMTSATGEVTRFVGYNQSVTGVCFQPSTDANDKFGTPSGLQEIWLRFDLYYIMEFYYDEILYLGVRDSNGNVYSARIVFRNRDYFAYVQIKDLTDTSFTIEPETLYQCLFHMRSGAEQGVIEITVGNETRTFVGNVNDGNAFSHFSFFRRDISKEVFWVSNIVASQSEIDISEGWGISRSPIEVSVKVPDIDARTPDGRLLSLPTRCSPTPIKPAVAVFYNNRAWYNPLVATDAENASTTQIFGGNRIYAFSKTL